LILLTSMTKGSGRNGLVSDALTSSMEFGRHRHGAGRGKQPVISLGQT
jgi:hypothetical protein